MESMVSPFYPFLGTYIPLHYIILVNDCWHTGVFLAPNFPLFSQTYFPFYPPFPYFLLNICTSGFGLGGARGEQRTIPMMSRNPFCSFFFLKFF